MEKIKYIRLVLPIRYENDNFPAGSINYLAYEKLKKYALNSSKYFNKWNSKIIFPIMLK